MADGGHRRPTHDAGRGFVAPPGPASLIAVLEGLTEFGVAGRDCMYPPQRSVRIPEIAEDVHDLFDRSEWIMIGKYRCETIQTAPSGAFVEDLLEQAFAGSKRL
jgi:hypothetical protein